MEKAPPHLSSHTYAGRLLDGHTQVKIEPPEDAELGSDAAKGIGASSQVVRDQASVTSFLTRRWESSEHFNLTMFSDLFTVSCFDLLSVAAVLVQPICFSDKDEFGGGDRPAVAREDHRDRGQSDPRGPRQYRWV